MKKKLSFIVGIILFCTAGFLFWNHSFSSSNKGIHPNQGKTSVKKYNRLSEEKSPYLLQHKGNPVHWFSWGEDAFQAAREENKIIFLSIGYSTCYWCHVMEKDSYENQEVADALNKDFISIKVDREEHPDVDQIYMDAVVRMIGNGGWPLNVFLTPDLKPFYGGTFFRRDDFLQLLSEVQDHWQKEPQNILASAEKITAALRVTKSPTSGELNTEVLRQAYHQLQKNFDAEYGGFYQAPKFPHSMSLSLLLRINRRTGNENVLKMVTKSLDSMAHGGIYDQLGGGFHRYSTDAKWLVPHFEKMLYDNALLASTYLEAAQVTHEKSYADVGRGILDYVLREMTEPFGGFDSAQDAGDVGKEGIYYTWTEKDIQQALTIEELKVFKKVYAIDRNIIHRSPVSSGINQTVETIRQKLLSLRLKYPPPRKDDKVLTAWNGLMIAAMAKGCQVLGDDHYLKAAQKDARFIEEKLYKNGKLLRRYRDGESRYSGTLDDYAFLIHGLLNLYESDFDPHWIEWAKNLQAKQDELFWDEKQGGYFTSESGETSLLVRKKEFEDGAMPSGNSITALNLQQLYALTFEENYNKKTQQLFSAAAGEIDRYPAGFAQTLTALDYRLDRSKEIAVVGKLDNPKTQEIKNYIYQTFLPNKVFALGDANKSLLPILKGKSMIQDKTTVYVCENNICKLPTTDLKKAKELIRSFDSYKP